MCCDATDSWKTTDGPAALSIIRKRVWHNNTFLYKVFYSQGRSIKKLKSVLNILYIVDLIIIVVEVCLFSGRYVSMILTIILVLFAYIDEIVHTEQI